MHHLTALQDKIVSECQVLIDQLKNTHTAEDLVEIQPAIYKLTEKISFLKVLKENPDLQEETEMLCYNNSEEESFELTEDRSEIPFTVYIPNAQESEIQEAVDKEEHLPVADDVLNDFTQHNDVLNETSVENSEKSASKHLESIQEEIFEEELISEAPTSEDAYERSVQLVENEDINSKSLDLKEITVTAQQKEDQRVQEEKKFRLAQIKALNKNVPSLFEVDEIPATPVTSIAKSNMPTDYMEAPKAKPDFKLDLNDKIAFSQKLFGGSQSEMNETIRVLNTFDNLDEAKEYLSDIYYQKNWGKVDDYAQRLWALVENKFL